MNLQIRPTISTDTDGIKAVLNTIELFPSEMLDDMIADYLTNPDTQDIWFTVVKDNTPIAFGYCAQEMLTEGTFNLYAIGVNSNLQGKGIGSQMITYLENHLKSLRGRILIVETSSGEDFALTRKFYENLHYKKEAVIRDFWNDGENKLVYWKKLK